MPKLVTYKCPDCNGTFDFLHHPSDEPPPDRCELCNAWMGDEPERAPVLHLRIASERNKVPDQVYRRMETASIERAEDAAEMTGGSISEMGAIKMTNLKDNTREGETAAISHIPNAAAAERNLSYATPVGRVGPEMQNPNAAQWVERTTSGPQALTTRGIINNLQTSGLAKQQIATATARGSDGKRY